MTDLSITSLLAEEERTSLRLLRIREAIEALRKLCDHDFIDDGNDSHHDYVKCKICGKGETR